MEDTLMASDMTMRDEFMARAMTAAVHVVPKYRENPLDRYDLPMSNPDDPEDARVMDEWNADYVAERALCDEFAQSYPDRLAQFCATYADAMLKAREQK